ncbi:MAG: hypothetical protein KIT22_13190 [Verrucomicrobiae bacterium]|nr:hypothetical protein [Verrucomicrobiae bacterium]
MNSPGDLDWEALERLRAIFLGREAARGPYWRRWSDLASYDATFGERIGWKWDAVIRELRARQWTLPAGPVLDFGCGSGVAGRRVLASFGAASGTPLLLHDRSRLAVSFARDAAVAAGREWRVEEAPRAFLDGTDPIGTLVVSHVLNELRESDRRRLMALVRRSAAVLWVEPGTHADSRALIEVRESLREAFHLVAPCTHAASCGLRGAGMERHWCHHFASPPAGVQADPVWTQFARRMGVDLRSLPYSYLVLDQRPEGSADPGWSRVVGAPRRYKGYARVFSCDASGVRDLRLTERALPSVLDALMDADGPRRMRWTTEGEDIVAAGVRGQ